MIANSLSSALGAIKARSGTPYSLVDGEGRIVRVMHISGDTYELAARNGQARPYQKDVLVDLLRFLRVPLQLSPVADVPAYLKETL